jgi:hypothetical protein
MDDGVDTVVPLCMRGDLPFQISGSSAVVREIE